MATLVSLSTMLPACHCSGRLSGGGTRCNQGPIDPGIPKEDDSVDLGAGETGPIGHGAVGGMVS